MGNKDQEGIDQEYLEGVDAAEIHHPGGGAMVVPHCSRKSYIWTRGGKSNNVICDACFSSQVFLHQNFPKFYLFTMRDTMFLNKCKHFIHKIIKWEYIEHSVKGFIWDFLVTPTTVSYLLY